MDLNIHIYFSLEVINDQTNEHFKNLFIGGL